MFRKIVLLIIIDQITKLIFSHRDFFLAFVHFHPMKNFSLAFSLSFGTSANLVLIVLSLIFFSYYYYSKKSELTRNEKIFLSLIFAGALSNIIDRVWLGYVRDFIDLGLNFTFNLADVYIFCGLIGLLFFKDEKREYNTSV